MSINQISTKVCIIGAGPAGLIVANILQKYRIPCLVIEKYSESEIYARSRAGLVDYKTISILQKYGLSDRLFQEGKAHGKCEFRTPETSLVIDYASMSEGQTHYTYPQQELLADLIAKFYHNGGEILFNTEGVEIENNNHGAKINCQQYGQEIVIDCDFIAGCDGFHGVSRQAIPQEIARPHAQQYDYAWLAITAEAPPSTKHIIYGIHPRGFAGHMLRTEKISRYYLQIPMGDTAEDWSSDRIWSELQIRLAKENWTLTEGKIIAKQVLNMRSYISSTMQYRSLFLAGDAAHIFTPAGGKGMNLAIQDGRVLAEAFVSFYQYQENLPLKNYSQIRFAEIWPTHEFSESLLHTINIPLGNSPQAISRQRLQEFKLAQLINSKSYGRSFAQQYVGYLPSVSNSSTRGVSTRQSQGYKSPVPDANANEFLGVPLRASALAS